jgi:hypothetical protein
MHMSPCMNLIFFLRLTAKSLYVCLSAFHPWGAVMGTKRYLSGTYSPHNKYLGTYHISPRTADSGRRTADGGRRTADGGGRRTADGRRRTADGGRRTAGGGQQTADGGRRAVNNADVNYSRGKPEGVLGGRSQCCVTAIVGNIQSIGLRWWVTLVQLEKPILLDKLFPHKKRITCQIPLTSLTNRSN